MEDCLFDDNDNPNGEGGAVAISHSPTGQRSIAVFRDCLFMNNNAASGGAMTTAARAYVQVHGSTFDGNTANTGGVAL